MRPDESYPIFNRLNKFWAFRNAVKAQLESGRLGSLKRIDRQPDQFIPIL
jgi:hypothetical protein